MYRPYLVATAKDATPLVGSFTSSQLAQCYAFPPPTDRAVTVGVISLGGGLVGSFDNNILVSGDVTQYLAFQGIGATPTVALQLLANATNNTTLVGETGENTLDVQSIVSCCPSSNLTVILYIIPNSFENMAYAIQYAATTPVMVRGVPHLPSILSVSWGAPADALPSYLKDVVNDALAFAAARGITVCCATGDNGSSDGLSSGVHVDFPSSSPNCLACGGTVLVCPTLVYGDASTSERAWSSGGGGVSTYFSKPAYQSALSGTGRLTPDVALNAGAGVDFIVYGQHIAYGGTSVSAPTMAGFLAAIDYRSFAPPALYALGAGSPCFHDLVLGSIGAYSAGPGWDASTGLGSVAGDLLGAALTNVPVTGVTIAPTSASLVVGATLSPTVRVLPAGASNQNVAWSTIPTGIATVAGGVVTAQNVGTCAVRATTVDGAYVATLTLTVVAPNANVPVTSVSASGNPSSVAVGATFTAAATVLPSTATNRTVTWTSSDATRASVDVASGLVRGVAAGNCSVSVTTSDGGFQDSFLLQVTPSVVPSTSVLVTPSELRLAAGDSRAVVATVLPSSVTDATVVWQSSNVAVGSVSSAGVVTANALGDCLIAATNGGHVGQLTLHVYAGPIIATGLSVTPLSAQVYAGDLLRAVATVEPANATDRTVTWGSSLLGVARVNPTTGLVTALAQGSTVISAATAATNGAFVASFVLDVLATPTPVTGISLPPPSLPLLQSGADLQLEAAVYPPDATNPTILWTSSDVNVATVAAILTPAAAAAATPAPAAAVGTAATVHAVAPGHCRISAATVNGGFVSAFDLTVAAVVVPAVGLTLSPATLLLERGAYRRVVATVQPPSATTPTLFSSTNEAVATVSVRGAVHARGVGTCVIRAVNGALVATTAVRVVPPRPLGTCPPREPCRSWFTRPRG